MILSGNMSQPWSSSKLIAATQSKEILEAINLVHVDISCRSSGKEKACEINVAGTVSEVVKLGSWKDSQCAIGYT